MGFAKPTGYHRVPTIGLLRQSETDIQLVTAVQLLDVFLKLRYAETDPSQLKDCFSMPKPLAFAATAPAAVLAAARELGRRMRLARVRRRIALRELASRAGISYDTARAVEAGSLVTGFGAYLAVIWALGLECQLTDLLNPDSDVEGKQLELARTPERARSKKGKLDDDF